MNWLRASIPLTIPLVLIALLWLIPVPPDASASSDATIFVGRSIGLGLLSLAVLAIAFIFHSLRTPDAKQAEPAPMALARHEFRRGFGTGRSPAPSRQPQPAVSPDIVVALPRSRGSVPASARSEALPQESIAMLTRRLHERAGRLWSVRAAERA